MRDENQCCGCGCGFPGTRFGGILTEPPFAGSVSARAERAHECMCCVAFCRARPRTTALNGRTADCASRSSPAIETKRPAPLAIAHRPNAAGCRRSADPVEPAASALKHSAGSRTKTLIGCNLRARVGPEKGQVETHRGSGRGNPLPNLRKRRAQNTATQPRHAVHQRRMRIRQVRF